MIATYPLVLTSNEADSLQWGHPALNLIHPVLQCGFGRDDEMRRANVTVVFHVADERDGLQGLTQTLKDKTYEI